MLKNIAPLLAIMDVTIILKQHSDGTDYVALVVPKPRKKPKNEKLAHFPPIIRRGPIDKLEAELNGQTVLSRLAEFRDLVVEDAAFQQAVDSVKNDKKEPAKAPTKKVAATKSTPKEAPPAKDKDLVLLDKTMADLQAAIDKGDADAAMKKYTATVSLYRTIKDRDESLVVGYPEKIRALKSAIEGIQQAKLDL